MPFWKEGDNGWKASDDAFSQESPSFKESVEIPKTVT
jgi:hypothetical protein